MKKNCLFSILVFVLLVGLTLQAQTLNRHTMRNGWDVVGFEGYVVGDVYDTLNVTSDPFSLPLPRFTVPADTIPLACWFEVDSTQYTDGDIGWIVIFQGADYFGDVDAGARTWTNIDTVLNTSTQDTTAMIEADYLKSGTDLPYAAYRWKVEYFPTVSDSAANDTSAYKLQLW